MPKILMPRSFRWIPSFQRYFAVIIAFQIKAQPLITQRARDILFTRLISAFNAGFVLNEN